jgi:hypothetical protein
VLRFLTSIVLSLLPERYRSRLASVSTAGTIASGVVELVGCVGLIVYRYFAFADAQMQAIPTHVVAGAAEQGGQTAVMGMGLLITMAYLIQAMTLLLTYFAIEGLARVAAAVVSGEVTPTLPLQLVALAHGRLAKAKYERDLGPPVEDLVSPGAGDFALCIATCRPKDWTHLTTISYEDKLYEVAREDTAAPPRRWVYVLRRRPEGKVIRGEIHQYRPDEAMPQKAAAAGNPQ